MSRALKAPFPWFGGKTRAAHLIWPRFGNVPNYVEPFFGSGATLWRRPDEWPPRVETVNDKDAYLANFWRAVQAEPEHVAWWADYPVNEADLHARHRWLVAEGRERIKRLMEDPTFYDVQVAGWWVWGLCLWIGSGWCAEPMFRRGKNETPSEQARRPNIADTGLRGMHRMSLDWPPVKRPSVRGNGDGHGVHQKKPHATRGGRGVNEPSLHRFQGGGQAGGSGVHSPSLWRQIPDLSGTGSAGRGVHSPTVARADGLRPWFQQLGDRLRGVRICCGDWARVLTPSITSYIGTTAVFLDPPYDHDMREICYSEDANISGEVRTWALKHSEDPKLRIALCGYQGEHDMPASWECVSWVAGGGYGRTARGKANRKRERIWFSPACLRPSDRLNFDEPIDSVEVSA